MTQPSHLPTEKSSPCDGAAAAWAFLSDTPQVVARSDWGGRRAPLIRAAVLLVVAFGARALGATGLPFVAGAMALVMLAVALVRPAPKRAAVERFLKRVANRVALMAGWVLMALAFVLVVVPFGLARRAFEGSELKLRPDRSAASYWSARNPGSSPEKLF